MSNVFPSNLVRNSEKSEYLRPMSIFLAYVNVFFNQINDKGSNVLQYNELLNDSDSV